VIRALIPGVAGATIPGDVDEDPGGCIKPCVWGV